MIQICNLEFGFYGQNAMNAYNEFVNKFGCKKVKTYTEIYFTDEKSVEFYIATKDDPKFVGLGKICKKWNVRCEGVYFQYVKDFSGRFKFNEQGLYFDGQVYESVLEGAYFHRFQLFLNLIEQYANEGQMNHIETLVDFKKDYPFIADQHNELIENFIKENI